MERIYFAPASKANPVSVPNKIERNLPSGEITYYRSMDKWTPYDDFKATVLSPLCKSPRFDTSWEYDAVPVWGVRPNSSKTWENIRPGDFVVFYTGNGGFEYIGRVDQKEINVELGEEVWPCYPLTAKRGSDGTGKPWSHVLYLDLVWKASIPQNWIQHLRNSKDTVIRRFDGVPKWRLRRIRKNIGNSTTDIVERCTAEVVSLAIKWDAVKADRFRGLAGDDSGEDEILSLVIESYDITIDELTDPAKRNVIDCVRRVYG